VRWFATALTKAPLRPSHQRAAPPQIINPSPTRRWPSSTGAQRRRTSVRFQRRHRTKHRHAFSVPSMLMFHAFALPKPPLPFSPHLIQSTVS